MNDLKEIRVALADSATSSPQDSALTRELTFRGRAAWALGQLIAAGSKGCTPIDNPAPRWAHYTFLLRRGGLNVETVTESHAGAYAGHHARYVLRSPVRVLEEIRA